MVVVRAVRERVESISAIMPERYIIICTDVTGKVTQQEIQNTNSYTHIHTTLQYTVHTYNRHLGRMNKGPRVRHPRHRRCIRRENQLASDTVTAPHRRVLRRIIAIITAVVRPCLTIVVKITVDNMYCCRKDGHYCSKHIAYGYRKYGQCN